MEAEKAEEAKIFLLLFLRLTNSKDKLTVFISGQQWKF